MIHSPHEGNSGLDGSLPSVRFLNLNRKITALSVGIAFNYLLALVDIYIFALLGCLQPGGKGTDSLFVGTQSNLLAYDVERNADVFFRDVQDGVNTVVIGQLGSISLPLVVTGGNCSILGYNKDGIEVFWTVTGDNVSSMTFMDIDGDGLNEMVVGSDDYDIRVYKNERLLAEVTEADRVTFLMALENKKFAYGLGNGTVGLYEGSSRRAWRVKTKNKVTCLGAVSYTHLTLPTIYSV